MGKLEKLYQDLSIDEKEVVEKSLDNTILLNKIYRIMCSKEIKLADKKSFLEKNNLTVKSFNYLVVYFISVVATDNQKEKIKYYNYYRKIRDPKYYQKIIQKILDEEDLVEKKNLLQEYSEIYSVNATKFGEETNQSMKIKETNYLYYQVLDDMNVKKKYLSETTKVKYLKNLKQSVLEIEQKIKQEKYHLKKDLKKVQTDIQKVSSFICSEEVQLYKSKIQQYYECILKQIVSVYENDPDNFNVLSYYGVTDVEPHYLLKKTLDNSLPLYNILLKKLIPAHENSYRAVYVSFLGPAYFQNIKTYHYQGVTLDANDLLELYHQMDDCLPKNEFVFMEFVRDYIRKNKDLFLNEKKRIK